MSTESHSTQITDFLRPEDAWERQHGFLALSPRSFDGLDSTLHGDVCCAQETAPEWSGPHCLTRSHSWTRETARTLSKRGSAYPWTGQSLFRAIEALVCGMPSDLRPEKLRWLARCRPRRHKQHQPIYIRSCKEPKLLAHPLDTCGQLQRPQRATNADGLARRLRRWQHNWAALFIFCDVAVPRYDRAVATV